MDYIIIIEIYFFLFFIDLELYFTITIWCLKPSSWWQIVRRNFMTILCRKILRIEYDDIISPKTQSSYNYRLLFYHPKTLHVFYYLHPSLYHCNTNTLPFSWWTEYWTDLSNSSWNFWKTNCVRIVWACFCKGDINFILSFLHFTNIIHAFLFA